MDIREKNKNLLIRHFEDGGKLNCTEKLGVELEHIVVDQKTRETIPYYGERGIGALLEKVAHLFPWHYEPEGMLIGVQNSDYSISLEPAGQLEISISPREEIFLIQKIYRKFRDLLEPILAEWGYELLTIGYHPVSKVRDLPLIPKKRYQYMDEYFKTSGTCGINMMRGTASAQVSIDYSTQEDFVTKIRGAYTLMPLLKLLTDNTPILEGEKYESHLARTYIWDRVDPKRTGIIPGLFDENFGFAAYAEFLMTMPLIFIETADGYEFTQNRTTEEIWAEQVFVDADIDHILSMNFQDVRLKHYIEIRYADSMPIEYVLGYTTLLKGLFYQKGCVKRLLDRLKPTEERILFAQENLAKNGFAGQAYDFDAPRLLEQLFKMAKQQLAKCEQAYLLPLEHIVKNRQTLAGEYDA